MKRKFILKVFALIVVCIMGLSFALGCAKTPSGSSSTNPPSSSSAGGGNSSSPAEPDKPVDYGEEYIFEAENAKLKGGSKGGLSIENAGTKGETFVGNFSDNVGASISFKVISDEDVTANFFVNLSKGGDTRVVTDFVVIIVNDDVYDSDGAVEALKDGEAEWFTFGKAYMGEIDLVEGENVIEFAMYESNVGFSVDSISLCTDDATLTEGVWEKPQAPVIDTEKPSYRYEAEKARLHTSLAIENNESASGGQVVGGVSNMAIDNPGEGFIEFTVNASAKGNAVLVMALALPNGLVSSTAFSITVNDAPVTVDIENIEPYAEGYENSWFNYTPCSVCVLLLEEGANVIKFVINGGATCNLDYIELNTDIILDGVSDKAHKCESVCEVCGKCKDSSCVAAECSLKCDCALAKMTYRFEAEKAQSNAWADGSNLLWQPTDDTTSGGMYVGHISDTAWSNPGEAYMSFTFEADKAATAFLSFCLSLPEGKVASSAFTIELNGEVITRVGNASGEIVPNDTSYENGWMNFTLCSVTKRLNLKKGSNVLKITVNGGAACNMDYLELATCASLTHSYAA